MSSEIVKLALAEDLYPLGDISSTLCIPPEIKAEALIITKEPCVMACGHIVIDVLEEYQNITSNEMDTQVKLAKPNGEQLVACEAIAQINGSALLILGAERTLLNFIQRFCGIATQTKKLVDLIKDYDCKLLDTRKTMPGMRKLEKEAFLAGGGTNHRFNLSDMVMLKENHLVFQSPGRLGELLDAMRAGLDKIETSAFKSFKEYKDGQLPKDEKIKIEVEVNKKNLDKLDLLLKTPIDVVMLDNFNPSEVAEITQRIRNTKAEIKVEASGGINENNIVDYAKTGVDYISTSAVFTQAKNIDMSMILELSN